MHSRNKFPVSNHCQSRGLNPNPPEDVLYQQQIVAGDEVSGKVSLACKVAQKFISALNGIFLQ